MLQYSALKIFLSNFCKLCVSSLVWPAVVSNDQQYDWLSEASWDNNHLFEQHDALQWVDSLDIMLKRTAGVSRIGVRPFALSAPTSYDQADKNRQDSMVESRKYPQKIVLFPVLFNGCLFNMEN